MEKQNISIAFFTPLDLQLFIATLLQEGYYEQNMGALKKVFCYGSKLPMVLRNVFYDKLNVELFYFFQQSNESLFVSCYDCSEPSVDGLTKVPIGSPVTGMQLIIVDQNNNVVAKGIYGQLIAKSVINDSELMNPNMGMARWVEEGIIEFVNPADNITLANDVQFDVTVLENLVIGFMDIKQVMVLVSGNDILLFYTNASKINYDKEIYLHLEELLPKYMLPTKIIKIKKPPFTISDEVDKNQLLILAQQADKPKDQKIVLNSYESQLLDLWQEVLEKEDIGIDESFFKLGGNSFKMIRLLSKINKKFNKNLLVYWMTTRQTIKEQAEYLLLSGQDH